MYSTKNASTDKKISLAFLVLFTALIPAVGATALPDKETLGYQITGAGQQDLNNVIMGSLYTAPTSGWIYNITAYIMPYANATPKIRYAIYSMDDSLLGGTEEFRSDSTDYTGLKTLELHAPVKVTAGESYWLMLWGNDHFRYQVSNASGNQGKGMNYSYDFHWGVIPGHINFADVFNNNYNITIFSYISQTPLTTTTTSTTISTTTMPTTTSTTSMPTTSTSTLPSTTTTTLPTTSTSASTTTTSTTDSATSTTTTSIPTTSSTSTTAPSSTTAWTTTSTSSSSTRASTTTSSVATTTTEELQCLQKGNNPPCNTVTIGEILGLLNDWINDRATIQDIIGLIDTWCKT